LLDRIESRLDRTGRDRLEGTGLPDRLREIIMHLDDIVLPRNIVFALGSDLSCTLTVASRRLLRVSVSTPEGNQVITATAGADRDERLVTMAEALAGLAAVEETLSIERLGLADGVAADEVGHVVADIRAFCEEHAWFEGQTVAAPLAEASPLVPAGWLLVDGEGAVLASGGMPEAAFPQGALTGLARDRAAWPADLAALAGQDPTILCPGRHGSLAVTLETGATRITRFGPGRLEDLVAALRRPAGGGQ
jgi:hypothetical protein